MIFCTVPREGESIFGTPAKPAKPDYKIDHITGCWMWAKGLTRQGYPHNYAHRLYLERATGIKVPKGWHTHHKCHTRACVNPDHLEAIEPTAHFREHLMHWKGNTLEDYHEIRRLVAQTGRNRVPYPEIAARYNVDMQTVYHVAKGWYWVEDLGGPVALEERHCEFYLCGKPLDPHKRRHAVYCCADCRQRANRAKRWNPMPSKWKKAA